MSLKRSLLIVGATVAKISLFFVLLFGSSHESLGSHCRGKVADNVLHCRQLGALETVCLVVMLNRKMMIKLSKCSLERVMPQTTDAMLLMLMLQCPAPNCGNALLAVRCSYSVY